MTGTVINGDGQAVAGAQIYAAAGDRPLAGVTTEPSAPSWARPRPLSSGIGLIPVLVALQ